MSAGRRRLATKGRKMHYCPSVRLTFVVRKVNVFRNLLSPHSWIFFFKCTSLSDKIGSLYLFLSVLKIVMG